MMIKIVSNTKREKIKKCIDQCNELLRNDDFYNEISSQSSFDMTQATPSQIANFIKNAEGEFVVKFFKPKGPIQRLKYRKTNAYTNKKYPNQLFLNTRRLNRSEEKISATIIHESVHVVDHQIEEFDFGHGNNSSDGKENTAPYWIGNLAYKILKQNDSIEIIDFTGIESIDSLKNPLEVDF